MLKKIITNEEIPIIEGNHNGYYEIFKDAEDKIIKKIWHQEKEINLKTEIDIINQKLSMLKFKSKQQLDEETQFTLLPQDDYELIITDLKLETRNKYQAKPNKEGKIPQEKVVNFTLEVVGLKDGSLAQDKEGKEAKGRKAFFTFRPEAMGYSEGGTIPSKSRSFLAFATGQEIDGELELESYDELIGKTIYAEIIEYTNQKGQRRNKISRILPPPRKK